MKKLYKVKLGLIIIILGMFFSLSAQYESTVLGGDFQDGSSWIGGNVPNLKWQTITISQGSTITKIGDFSWEEKVTINGVFTVTGNFSGGYGGVEVNGELNLNNGSLSGAKIKIGDNAIVDIAKSFNGTGGVVIGSGAQVKLGENFDGTGGISIGDDASLDVEGSFVGAGNVDFGERSNVKVTGNYSLGGGSTANIKGNLEINGDLKGGGSNFIIHDGVTLTVNKVDASVPITVKEGGTLIVNGDFSLSQTLTIQDGGSVIINGVFWNGVVKNSGSLIVYGSYTNNAGGGTQIYSTGRTEVFGNLAGSQNFEIDKGGVLLVHGNFSSTGSNVKVQGTLVVAGDFSSSSSTIVDGNEGNLVVGGDFKASGGINTKYDNLYIIDPNANVDYPGGSKKNYGGLPELKVNEEGNSELESLIEEVLPGFVSNPPNQWGGSYNQSWLEPRNWTGNKLPEPGANVRIKSAVRYPIVPKGSLVIVNNLTINPDAQMTLAPGSQLTVEGDLNILTSGGLVLENKLGANGLASLITKGSVVGEAEVKLQIEGDRWYYLSSAIKTPTFGELGAADSPLDFRIDIYRKARWISIYPQNGASKLRELEGVSVKNSVIETRRVDLLGELNSGEIIRAFAEGGWHIFGNPYPSAISWRNSEGWTKENILPTIWYRTQIGSEMTFVTYNAESDISSHTPEEANEFYTEGDDFSIIPPYQAVWIRTATNGPASITVDNRVRLHSLSTSTEDIQAPQLKSASTNTEVSKIRISASNRFSRDGSVIYFSDNNAEGFGTEDSEKYFNDSKNIPEVYTRVDTRSLAINGVPTTTESVKSIPISVRNRVEGDVSLGFDLSHFTGEHAVYFEDKATGAFLNVARNSTYEYSVKQTGEDHDRFVLHLYKVTTDLEEVRADNDEIAAGEEISIKSIAGKVLVSVGMDLVQQNPGTIEIYTIDGRKVSEVPARSSRTLVLLPNERGVYIVRAQFGQLVKSERVVNASK